MKKIKFTLLAVATGFLMTSCDTKSNEVVVEDETTTEEVEANSRTLEYDISPKSGAEISGTVSFTQIGDGEVMMVLKVANMEPGEHAVHIHEFQDCSSDDGMSAGGHWNPTEMDHGKWDTDDFHMGDIGNLVANEDGYAEMTFSTDEWCLGCDDKTKNILGHSLIIHEDADDFETQPTGNAGGRIGCVEL